MRLNVFVTFFEKKVTPKNFTTGKVFGLHSALDRCAHLVRTNTSVKVFSQVFFKKLAGYQGRALRHPPQRAKYLYRSKNAGEGEFLCNAKKEGEPSSGGLPDS